MSAASPYLSAAIELIDARASQLLAQVEQWAAINSGSDNLVGLSDMADVLAEAFAPLGATLTCCEPAPASVIDRLGREQPLALGRNLHFVQRPEAPVQLLLTGHMDTVFGRDHAFQTCRWIDERRLNGPGVADMKGGIAVMLAALTALEASPLSERIGYEIILNSDEEISSPGSAPLIAEAAGRVQAALTFEPCQPDGMLVGARKGSGNFSITIYGRAAHAGRNPEQGRNAIVAAADLVLRLAALGEEGLSVNPARIEGGSPNNIVPDLAIVRVNMRPLDADRRMRAEQGLAEAMAAVGRIHDVHFHLHGGFSRPPKPLDKRQLRLFNIVKSCGAELGIAIDWKPSGGVCDGNNLAAAGVPVVDTMGVRGGAIHSDGEYLLVDSLAERAKLAAGVMLRIAADPASVTRGLA